MENKELEAMIDLYKEIDNSDYIYLLDKEGNITDKIYIRFANVYLWLRKKSFVIDYGEDGLEQWYMFETFGKCWSIGKAEE